MNRWPFIFVVLGLVAAGVAYDRVSEAPAGIEVAEVIEPVDVVSPSLTDPPRLDSAWYCPLGSSSAGGFADHEIMVSNLSEVPAVANLSILTAEGPGAGRRIELGPLQTERVQVSENQESQVAGAVVEIISGNGVVGHAVTTDQGRAEGPCGTHVSSSWFFASGRTELDSKQYLALMNPFPETAVFDIEFRTLARSRQPLSLQGAFVPARSVRIIDIGEHITSEANVATIITTQRGRLVAERLQVVDGSLGANGAALQLGVAGPSSSWILPAGRVHADGDHRLIIFNPAEPGEPVLVEDEETGEEVLLDDQQSATAVVDVQMWPNNPTDLSLYGVVTTTREIRPGSFEAIDIGAQAERFGFPLPYELGVNVLVQNDLPVVVERWQVGKELQDPSNPAAITAGDAAESEDESADDATGEDGEESEEGDEGADDGSDEAAAAEGSDPSAAEEESEGDFEVPVFDIDGEPLPQPIATAGLSTTRGVEKLSTRWVIPWISIVGDSTTVAIAAPEEASIEVRTLVNGAFVGPVRATVPRGGRTIVALEAAGADGGVVEVISDVPVAVEAMTVIANESLDVVPAVPTIERS
jgi:hypothetical protein